jgi:hypothetical protein
MERWSILGRLGRRLSAAILFSFSARSTSSATLASYVISFFTSCCMLGPAEGKVDAIITDVAMIIFDDGIYGQNTKPRARVLSQRGTADIL